MTELAAPPATGPRLLAGWVGSGRPDDLAAHVTRHGPLPDPTGLIDAVAAAGLRGRGGAWFPTSRKLGLVAAGRRPGTVVANGVDGEPASDKDNALLTVAPHLVLDGAVLAALAVGARDVIVCVPRGAPLVATVATAIGQRADPVPVRVAEIPRRYVAGEESALVHYLTTGEARPTDRPPSVLERGVRGRPTLVDNVETLADVALIARYGADWFRAVGVPSAPGTTLVTTGGAVGRPGVLEVPVGTTIPAVCAASGGLAGAVRAVLVGGFGGRWVPAGAGVPLGPDTGLGVLLALAAGACGIATTAHVLRYLAGESAGQCGPCMFGLPAISRDVDELAAGPRPGSPVPARLPQRLATIDGRGACGHPDGAVRLVRSALTVFADDVAAHANGRPCGGGSGFAVPGPGMGWR